MIRRKFLSSGRNLEIVVRGNSMQPLFNDGDRILLTYCRSFNLGDVVVFEYDGSILVHRILKIDGSYIYCKGDNCFRLEKTTTSEIIGKVLQVNGCELKSMTIELINLSYCVGCNFEEVKNNEKVKNMDSYKKYKELIGYWIDDT